MCFSILMTIAFGAFVVVLLHELYDLVYAGPVKSLKNFYDSIHFYLFIKVLVTNTLSSSSAHPKSSLNSSTVKTPDSIPIS